MKGQTQGTTTETDDTIRTFRMPGLRLSLVDVDGVNHIHVRCDGGEGRRSLTELIDRLGSFERHHPDILLIMSPEVERDGAGFDHVLYERLSEIMDRLNPPSDGQPERHIDEV